MDKAIVVDHLLKNFEVTEKKPGLVNSFTSIFSPQKKTIRALRNISFTVESGELVGFIGPNGAGKTTTLKVLSGLLYPTSGHVSVLGYIPWDRKPAFQKQFSLVMGQKNQLWWDLPAMESFILNKEIYEVPQAQYNKTLDELVDLLEVKDYLKVQVRKLSLGQRMKMELIAALITSPKILFLDEPTIGLDVVMQKKMRDFIKEYNRRFNSTIILTSHYMDDVKELCERVIIIDKGKLLFDGALSEIIKKFANHKLLTVVFSEPVDEKKLADIGVVKKFDYPQCVISVRRNATSLAAAELLQHFPVADLNIEEPQIEDIIREVFTG